MRSFIPPAGANPELFWLGPKTFIFSSMRGIAPVLLVALCIVLLCLQIRERVQVIRNRTSRSLYASSSHPEIEVNREREHDEGVVSKPTSVDVRLSILHNDTEIVNITEIPVVGGGEGVEVVDGEETTETTSSSPILNEEESQEDSSPASPTSSTSLPINLPFSSSFKSSTKQYIRDPPIIYTSKVSYYNWGDGKYGRTEKVAFLMNRVCQILLSTLQTNLQAQEAYDHQSGVHRRSRPQVYVNHVLHLHCCIDGLELVL